MRKVNNKRRHLTISIIGVFLLSFLGWWSISIFQSQRISADRPAVFGQSGHTFLSLTASSEQFQVGDLIELKILVDSPKKISQAVMSINYPQNLVNFNDMIFSSWVSSQGAGLSDDQAGILKVNIQGLFAQNGVINVGTVRFLTKTAGEAIFKIDNGAIGGAIQNIKYIEEKVKIKNI